ncbi:MAG TPA: hypothetical protein VLE97_09905, partial [Gaiellaceae bacterium]|nr:hypothetical protein [Gaiellaceae bacterium]
MGNQRGEYGSAAHPSWRPVWVPRVGEDPAFDAPRALDHVSSEMEAVTDEIYRAMGVDPATIRRPAVADEAWMQRVRAAQAKAKQSPLWTFWESSASPKYDDWQAARKGFASRPMARADYDRWLGRVNELREEARGKGVKLAAGPVRDVFTAAPLAPTSPSEEGKRSLWKWAAIGGAAILGVVAASSLASSTKDERA